MNTTELAKKRTKLANQRTYLSYMHTGFTVAGVAGVFKKWWITFFGIFMIVTSTFQYYIINYHLDQNISIDYKYLDMIPLVYFILGLGVLFLQIKKK